MVNTMQTEEYKMKYHFYVKKNKEKERYHTTTPIYSKKYCT